MALCMSQNAQAQRHAVYADNIATLQVVADNDWLNIPAIELGSRSHISISFDELSHTYHRYSYTVTHCEADWSESTELFTSDYIEGFQSGATIDDFEESINTNQLYTHYTLNLPNDRCSFRMSGNYRCDVIDEETLDTVLTARFYVVEPLVRTSALKLVDTDIDIRKSHQQLDVRIDYPQSLTTTDPRKQFTVKVMQNERVDNMRTLSPAPQLMHNAMQWTHSRELIFDAGNEYHKYEFLDVHRNSLGVEHIRWDGEAYHIDIFHDTPRRNYVYDEDANGSFLVRNSDNIEVNTATEYAVTHFYLDTPPLQGDVYIEGKWTLNDISEKYLMTYNEQQHCYEIALPLKMGYYSYQYLFVPYGSTKATVCPTEGSFFETENSYTVLTYYRGNIDRATRLVGIKTF